MNIFNRLHFVSHGRHLPAKSHSDVASTGRCSAVGIAICAAAIGMASCAGSESQYRWKTSEESLKDYHEFLEKSRLATDASMESISKDIVEWQTLEDSVKAFVKRDSTIVDKPHFYPLETIKGLHDSVRDEILNRAKAKPRTFKDVYVLKRFTSRYSRDPTAMEMGKVVQPFFLSLDSVNIYNKDLRTILRQYNTYLYNVEKQGIHDKQQWLIFMREEDRLFRSFVPHLHEMGGISARGITKRTENIYRDFLQSSAIDSIGNDALLIYMAMRNNRRLLTNALGCVADIKANKVKSADQLEAYMWMIVQPFFSVDDLGMALLTERQTKEFETLAKETPSAMRSIISRAKLDKSEYDNMPDIIVNLYISSL